MGQDRAASVLAAADVLCSFESYQLLIGDQDLGAEAMTAVLVASLTACSTASSRRCEREARVGPLREADRRSADDVWSWWATRRACASGSRIVSSAVDGDERVVTTHRPADTRAPPHRRPAPAPLPVPHRCPMFHEHLGTIDVFDLGTAPASSLTAPTPTCHLALLIGGGTAGASTTPHIMESRN